MLYKVFGNFVSFWLEFIFRDICNKGMEKDITLEKTEFVQRLWLETDFTPNKIASLARISIAFVKKVKKGLK